MVETPAGAAVDSRAESDGHLPDGGPDSEEEGKKEESGGEDSDS